MSDATAGEQRLLTRSSPAGVAESCCGNRDANSKKGERTATYDEHVPGDALVSCQMQQDHHITVGPASGVL